MAHSYVCTRIHVVFSTKDRRKSIPKEQRDRLWSFIGGIAKTNGLKAIAIGGMPDHVHVLLVIPADMAVAKCVQLIKAGSSKWCNRNLSGGRFAWQEGYGAFSVSASQIPATVKYIQEQEEHHRQKSFEEEFVMFLKRNGVNYDPKYVFG